MRMTTGIALATSSTLLVLLAAACGGAVTETNETELNEEALRRRVACEGLRERQCLARPNVCEAEYIEVGYGCACPDCGGREECPPCDCPPAPPPVKEYVGCHKIDPCSKLDERSCLANPTCEVVIGPCPMIACADNTDPALCECHPTVIGCQTKQPVVPPPGCRDGTTNCDPTPAPPPTTPPGGGR